MAGRCPGHLEHKYHQQRIEYGQDGKAILPYLYEFGNGDQAEHYIANITDGTKWGYKEFIFEPDQGAGEISLLIRGKGEGNILVYADREEHCLLAELRIELNWDLQNDQKTDNWRPVKAKIKRCQGIHPVYFVYQGDQYLECLSFTFESLGQAEKGANQYE